MTDLTMSSTLLNAAADGCGEPRDLTGHPGHAKLREFWRVAPQAAKSAPVKKPDVVDNHTHAITERNKAQAADMEARARRAWELHQDGLSIEQAGRAAGITSLKSLYPWWRRLGFKTRAGTRGG